MKRAGVEIVVPSLQPNPDEPDSPTRSYLRAAQA